MGSSKADEQTAKKYFQENGTLVNKLGITDQKKLEKAEAMYVERKTVNNGLSKKAQEISKKGLKAMHKELFSEVYAWAGQFRDYTTGRGIPFCKPEYIDNSLDKIYKDVNSKIKPGISDKDFAKAAGEFIGELNAIHPFIDGNGRTQRQSLRNLARVAEKSIDLDKINKTEWYKAAKKSHALADNSDFEKIIAGMVTERTIPKENNIHPDTIKLQKVLNQSARKLTPEQRAVFEKRAAAKIASFDTQKKKSVAKSKSQANEK